MFAPNRRQIIIHALIHSYVKTGDNKVEAIFNFFFNICKIFKANVQDELIFFLKVVTLNLQPTNQH